MQPHIQFEMSVGDLESWFFKPGKSAANTLDLSTIENWAIPGKVRDPIINILQSLSANNTTHPGLFKA